MQQIKYIYTISHPITNEIVYVGASNNVEQRARGHLSSLNVVGSLPEWLRGILFKGLIPKFTIIDKCSDEWRVVEREYIIKYFNEGQPILNSQCKGLKLNKLDRFTLVDLTINQ